MHTKLSNIFIVYALQANPPSLRPSVCLCVHTGIVNNMVDMVTVAYMNNNSAELIGRE